MVTIQICPAYPPEICGVGDYAAVLACSGLFGDNTINTVVSNSTSSISCERNAYLLKDQSQDTMLAALAYLCPDTVLLHYSGYGYGRWGLCYWLIDALEVWKKSYSGTRLVTVFHEVYAKRGSIWSSSFWTSESQLRIARRLSRLSDAACVTSKSAYSLIKTLTPDLPLELLPVFSTVGEPNFVSSIGVRAPLAIVFGGAGSRCRVYKSVLRNEGSLVRVLDKLNIAEVYDIGPKDIAPSFLAYRPISALGSLDAAHISSYLANARIGLIDYPGHVLSKSSIAAAFFSHGLLMVNTNSSACNSDNPTGGSDFVSLRQLASVDSNFSDIALAGLTWYKTHCIKSTVERIGSLLS